jgi:TolA-binding protein
MKGFRTPPQADRIKQLETELQNMQMASRVSQMMIQQLMQNLKNMSEDLSKNINQFYELQYKFNAIQKHLNLDLNTLNEIANSQRLVDFESAAAKADEKEGLLLADEATPDSTIVITSTASDEAGVDNGIFRSRLKLSESGSPELIEKLTGKKVGDKVTVTLNGLQHEVQLLSIKKSEQLDLSASLEVSH